MVEFLSLDGVMQAPGHAEEDRDGGFEHGGWTGPFMSEHRRYMTEALASVGALLLGRVTYDIFSSYWPTVTDPADQIARIFNRVPKYVVSTTLSEGPWDETVVIGGDVPDRVAQLKRTASGDVFVIGSSRLAQTLQEHELTDAYQLWLHPVVLGTGKRLFAEGAPLADFALVTSRTTQGGLVILDYAREAPPDRSTDA